LLLVAVFEVALFVFMLLAGFVSLLAATLSFSTVVVFTSFLISSFFTSSFFGSSLVSSFVCFFFSSAFFFLCSKYFPINLEKSFPDVAAR
jgi:hypothetical protein